MPNKTFYLFIYNLFFLFFWPDLNKLFIHIYFFLGCRPSLLEYLFSCMHYIRFSQIFLFSALGEFDKTPSFIAVGFTNSLTLSRVRRSTWHRVFWWMMVDWCLLSVDWCLLSFHAHYRSIFSYIYCSLKVSKPTWFHIKMLKENHFKLNYNTHLNIIHNIIKFLQQMSPYLCVPEILFSNVKISGSCAQMFHESRSHEKCTKEILVIIKHRYPPRRILHGVCHGKNPGVEYPFKY